MGWGSTFLLSVPLGGMAPGEGPHWHGIWHQVGAQIKGAHVLSALWGVGRARGAPSLKMPWEPKSPLGSLTLYTL